MADKFQVAHQRARVTNGAKWFLLSDDEQAHAVAVALRSVDSTAHPALAEVVNDRWAAPMML
jgi:hypothetical protein